MLRDAEDRTRALRWQQHQLTSFMAEVKELIRPEVRLADQTGDAEALLDEAPVEHALHAEDVDAVHEQHDEPAPAESVEAPSES